MAFPVNVDSTWVGNVSNPVSLDNGELRRADAALFAGNGAALGVSGGIVRHGDSSLAVSIDASDNVTIQPGPVVIPGNAVAGTGCYRFALGTATTQSITSLRDSTNPKIVLVVARQMDTDVVSSHAAYTGRFDVIAGTPSATPSAPALPSMAVELGRITLPATGGGAATVDSTHRTFAAAIGGTLPVATKTMLPASAALHQRAIALDTGVEYVWNGSSWDGGWVNLTPRNGLSANFFAYRRIGSQVYLNVDGSLTTSSGTSVTIANSGSIPAALVPGYQVRSGGYFAGYPGTITVGIDGSVSVLQNSGSSKSSVAGVMAWPIG